MNEYDRRSGHRWFQISLRSVFLLTFFVAACLARYRSVIREFEELQRAAEDGHAGVQRAEEDAKRVREQKNLREELEASWEPPAAEAGERAWKPWREVEPAIQLDESPPGGAPRFELIGPPNEE